MRRNASLGKHPQHEDGRVYLLGTQDHPGRRDHALHLRKRADGAVHRRPAHSADGECSRRGEHDGRRRIAVHVRIGLHDLQLECPTDGDDYRPQRNGTVGNVSYSVENIATSTDLNYNNIQSSQQFTNVDNESKNFYISPQTGLTTTRAGGTATFTVVLTAAPTGTVTVNLVSNDPALGPCHRAR